MPDIVADHLYVASKRLPYLGRRNIWVQDAGSHRDSLAVSQMLIAHGLRETTPGQLEVIVYDGMLSGIASPFPEVNSGGERILRIVSDEDGLKQALNQLATHISSVQNIIQRREPDLLSFRRKNPGVQEGYKLVVLAVDFAELSAELRDRISLLLLAGPTAGVTFLIHSITQDVNEFVMDQCDHYQIQSNGMLSVNKQPVGVVDIPDPDTLIAVAQCTARQIAITQLDPVAFEEIQDTEDLWPDSSRDGITFAAGTYGLSTIEVTLGDELNQRHNALITGAVGQGKSNLISVLIHSLCQRYSPAELELYLLDLKEGVTLQPFAPDQAGCFLPHARVLGLDADRHYAVNVLRHLYALYKQRMATFKAAGVQSIRHYRLAKPEAVMPRIVVVIDEFQLLFADDDDLAHAAADLLVKGARLFRACGIHFVLASQTIGGNLALVGASEGLFAQVPVRLALKNSLAESQATLGIKNDAASHLRSRQAIVNLDYGEVAANRKTTIAYADEAVLAPMRRQWHAEAVRLSSAPLSPPEVFEGQRPLSLSADGHYLSSLRSGRALLGRSLSVGIAPLAVEFSTDLGRNLALLGTGPGHAVLLNAVLSLAQHQPGARFIIMDLAGTWEQTELVPAFDRQMNALQAGYELCDKHQAIGVVTQFAADLETASSDQGRPTYLIGLGVERWRTDTEQFQDLLKHGPLAGIHVLVWWRKLSAFEETIGYGGQSNFDIRAAMHLDSASASDLFNDPLLRWTPEDNRMLVWDIAEMTHPQPVIPYSLITSTT